ncbi:MAG: EAL domain-containing protein, partial [Pseudomonadota bacterium]
KGVPEDTGKAKLVRGMIALGQGLGLTVVAEGAETPSEVEFLTQSGCDAIQGFYFAKPQAVDDLPGALQHITSAGRLAVPERRFA